MINGAINGTLVWAILTAMFIMMDGANGPKEGFSRIWVLFLIIFIFVGATWGGLLEIKLLKGYPS